MALYPLYMVLLFFSCLYCPNEAKEYLEFIDFLKNHKTFSPVMILVEHINSFWKSKRQWHWIPS